MLKALEQSHFLWISIATGQSEASPGPGMQTATQAYNRSSPAVSQCSPPSHEDIQPSPQWRACWKTAEATEPAILARTTCIATKASTATRRVVITRLVF